MSSNRWLRAAAILATLSLSCGVAVAQSYPARPIKIIVPFAPGGPVDETARALAQYLSSFMGQKVLVENQPGAVGATGSIAVARAEPDGYTLLLGNEITLGLRPALMNLNYDPVKNFDAVGTVSKQEIILTVNPKVPAMSCPELVAFAKSKPGVLQFASSGNNSQPHLAGDTFGKRAGIRIVHVPYRGSSAAIADVVSGQVEMIFEGMGAVLQFINARHLRPLAIASAARIPRLPELPTMEECGYPGFFFAIFTALLAPSKTPSPVIARLNAEINVGLKSPELASAFARLGAEPFGGSPQDLTNKMAGDLEKWRSIARLLDMKSQ